MPPKKTDDKMTSAELRKLIRAHNVLVSIKIPKGTDRDGLIKLIEDKGYKVNHKMKKIVDSKKDRPRRPKVTLEEAKEITKPKPKTALQKQKIAEAKAEKEEKKKKEQRAITKEAVEKSKKGMGKSKAVPKKKSKPVKKEDEVRPKEKVGRPKVDPKKIKVIEKKKDKPYRLLREVMEEKRAKEIKYKDFSGLEKIVKRRIKNIFSKEKLDEIKKSINKKDITMNELKKLRTEFRDGARAKTTKLYFDFDDKISEEIGDDGLDEKIDDIQSVFDKFYEPFSEAFAEKVKILKKAEKEKK